MESVFSPYPSTQLIFWQQFKLDCNCVISISSGQAARDREHVNPQNTSVLIKNPADLIQRDLSSPTVTSPRCKHRQIWYDLHSRDCHFHWDVNQILPDRLSPLPHQGPGGSGAYPRFINSGSLHFHNELAVPSILFSHLPQQPWGSIC